MGTNSTKKQLSPLPITIFQGLKAIQKFLNNLLAFIENDAENVIIET